LSSRLKTFLGLFSMGAMCAAVGIIALQEAADAEARHILVVWVKGGGAEPWQLKVAGWSSLVAAGYSAFQCLRAARSKDQG
jgi:hypothetical protein